MEHPGSFEPHRHGWRLPPYAKAAGAVREALPSLNPPARKSVIEAAQASRIVESPIATGPWRPDIVPAMVEPMTMVTSRLFTGLIFAGPARSGKTDSLVINPVVHAITCNPRNVHITQMDQTSARSFSIEKISHMIRRSPRVAERLAKLRNADNIFDKRFTGDMRLSIGWPVVAQLSSRDIPLTITTDYDRISNSEDLDGEGELFALQKKRGATFFSTAMAIAESSPGRPILDVTFSPRTPHEAPPTTGILGLYNRGTRGRRYWTCRDCGEDFMPWWDRLSWDDIDDIGKAAASVVMPCPHCGTVYEPGHKLEMEAGGFWLHETDDRRLVRIEDYPPTSKNLSYWQDGTTVPFASWPQLVAAYLTAERHFDATGDEGPLKTTVNVDQGLPFLSRARQSAIDLSVVALKDQATAEIGTAPAWTRFITIAVDVQRGRFVCQADAWGPDMRRQLIDRFDLTVPPGKNVERALDPGRKPEDWAVLDRLAKRAYPVAGEVRLLKACGIAIDSHGEPGVTPNAYAFWRRKKSEGAGNLFRLVRGGNEGFKAAYRAKVSYPERAANKAGKVARDVPLILIATDKIKDEVVASLAREDDGPAAYTLPADLDDDVFEEFVSEERSETGWEKKPGVRRNEAFDLAVYGRALAIVMKAEKIDWSRPPRWAAEVRINAFAVDAAEDPDETPQPNAKPARRGRRVRSRGV